MTRLAGSALPNLPFGCAGDALPLLVYAAFGTPAPPGLTGELTALALRLLHERGEPVVSRITIDHTEFGPDLRAETYRLDNGGQIVVFPRLAGTATAADLNTFLTQLDPGLVAVVQDSSSALWLVHHRGASASGPPVASPRNSFPTLDEAVDAALLSHQAGRPAPAALPAHPDRRPIAVDVPVRRLYDLLQWLVTDDRVPAGQPAQRNIKRGLAFGRQLAARFRGGGADPLDFPLPGDTETTDLAGFGALLYLQLAGRLDHNVTGQPIHDLVAALSHTSMDTIRAALPGPVNQYLHTEADPIGAELLVHYQTGLGPAESAELGRQFGARIAAEPHATDLRDLLLPAGPHDDHPITHRQYLDSALRQGLPDRVDQATGMHLAPSDTRTTLSRDASGQPQITISINVLAEGEDHNSAVRRQLTNWLRRLPPAATGTVGSLPLGAAVEALDGYVAGSADCVLRVSQVLARISPPAQTVDDLTAGTEAGIARWLGGRFQPVDGIDRLEALEPGDVTVLLIRRPGQTPHMVLVERQPDQYVRLGRNPGNTRQPHVRIGPAAPFRRAARHAGTTAGHRTATDAATRRHHRRRRSTAVQARGPQPGTDPRQRPANLHRHSRQHPGPYRHAPAAHHRRNLPAVHTGQCRNHAADTVGGAARV